jgi:hypothetical protein
MALSLDYVLAVECKDFALIETTKAELESAIEQLVQGRDREIARHDSMVIYNDQLAAECKVLRDALRHLAHNARKSGADMGLALDVAQDALQGANHES